MLSLIYNAIKCLDYIFNFKLMIPTCTEYHKINQTLKSMQSLESKKSYINVKISIN